MIAGIILAAGASERMGSPKPLLTVRGKTFLQHILDTLESARVTHNIIVLGAQVDEIQRTLDWFRGSILINREWREGQLSSLKKALTTLDSEKVEGCIICPVDHPLLSQQLIVNLLQGFWTSQKNIIIPTYQGTRGHPVLFGRVLFDALRSASLQQGAKAVVRNYSNEVLEVPVQENGILVNIDTPEDYQLHIRNHSV